jgi:hypothetical protein
VGEQEICQDSLYDAADGLSGMQRTSVAPVVDGHIAGEDLLANGHDG